MNGTGRLGCGIELGLQFPTLANGIEKTSFVFSLAISFTTDRDGNVASLSAQFEPMVADIVFMRVPSGGCMDVAFREARVGRYRHGSITHVVSLQADGQLTLAGKLLGENCG